MSKVVTTAVSTMQAASKFHRKHDKQETIEDTQISETTETVGKTRDGPEVSETLAHQQPAEQEDPDETQRLGLAAMLPWNSYA